MSEPILQAIWFALWGLLWAIYFGLNGFDLGTGILAGVVKGDKNRAFLITSLAPVWDGNEVWLITAGGVTFAAFPKVYAVMFSSLYLPLMIILLSLVLRAVAIEFFHHQDYSPEWQKLWLKVLSGSSFLVPLLFGVAFGNIFQGVLLGANGYEGNILTLLNPYGLLTGLLFVLVSLYNGAAWMAHKAGDEETKSYSISLAKKFFPWLFVVAAAFLVYTPFATNLMANYLAVPVLFVVPLLAVALLVLSWSYVSKGKGTHALVSGSLVTLVTVLTGIIGLFPNMFPSKIDGAFSLTAHNASSSHYTLVIMLVVTLIFLPLVLIYQVYAYKLFGKGGTGHEADTHY